MYFESLQALLSMGGHGGYVWTAYAVTCLVIANIVVAPMRRHKRLLRQLHRTQNRPQSVASGRTT